MSTNRTIPKPEPGGLDAESIIEAFSHRMMYSVARDEFNATDENAYQALAYAVRDRLMDRVWDSAPLSDTSTVTVHVRRLRAKIEPDPERPRFIQTVWGVGYRFQP